MVTTFSATRDQLIDAIAGCQPASITTAGGVVKISAESMADAIIEGLAAGTGPVHYRWPPACGADITAHGGSTSGKLALVTCEGCLDVEGVAGRA